MRSNLLAVILAVAVFGSVASLIDSAVATNTGPGCCVCGEVSLNMTAAVSGSGSAATACFDVAEGDRTCGLVCGGLYSFVNASCSDPALAEVCSRSTMAPASSPTGLVALIAALAGFGAFWLRRRSQQA